MDPVQTQETPPTHLHSASGFSSAGADVEETHASRLRLSPCTRRPSAVDDHRLPFEQAHQVRWLLTLSDAHLNGGYSRHDRNMSRVHFISSTYTTIENFVMHSYCFRKIIKDKSGVYPEVDYFPFTASKNFVYIAICHINLT